MKNIRFDIQSGLTVFLIALPLCLGISLASGAPISSGIISGVIGGIVTSIFSKSVYSVSGPAAGLTTIVASGILSLGDFNTFLSALIIGGVFQIILGLLKLGTIVDYFPSSIIKGMLSAIGLILIFKQIPYIFGMKEIDEVLNLFSLKFKVTNLSTGSLLIAIISFIYYFIKKHSLKSFTILPTALVIVLIGISFQLLFSSFLPAISLKKHEYVQIPSNILSNINLPKFKSIFENFDVIKIGITIGIVTTIETLLSIKAVDKLDPLNRITPKNKELVAQGIGNVFCGILGGIPITSVIVRGSANIDAGAKTKKSAVFHGIFLLISVLFIPKLINLIPFSSLSVILLMTGYNLTKPIIYKNMWRLGINQFIPFILTLFLVLIEDLLFGVAIGIITSLIFIIKNNYNSDFKILKEKLGDKYQYTIVLTSIVSFLDKNKLSKILYTFNENESVIIDGSNTHHIDYDVVEMISEFHNYATENKINIRLIGIEKVELLSTH